MSIKDEDLAALARLWRERQPLAHDSTQRLLQARYLAATATGHKLTGEGLEALLRHRKGLPLTGMYGSGSGTDEVAAAAPTKPLRQVVPIRRNARTGQ